MPIRVLLVDNKPLLRHGIRLILQSARDIEVIGEATDGNEAVDKAVALFPDIVLIESVLPGSDSIAAIRAIRQRCPSARNLVLGAQADEEAFRTTVAAGAFDYFLKDISPEDLVNGIRAAYSGRTILNLAIPQRMRLALSEESANSNGGRRAIGGRDPGLTRNETEVLRCVARGLSGKEIAAQLFLTKSQVKTRLKNIYRKLGFKNRAQAAVFAAERGLRYVGPIPEDALVRDDPQRRLPVEHVHKKAARGQ